jgi:diamine N-acetyltransferase
VQAPAERIRPAAVDDAGRLAELGAKTFLDAYCDTNDPADLADYVAATYGERQLAAELRRPDVTYLIAESGEEAVGFAKLVFGSDQPAVAAAEPAELEQLYVRQDRHGTGVGSALLAAAVEQARKHRCDVLWLGVWEHNPRAIAFYERHGFSRLGTHSFRLGTKVQTDWVMARSLIAGQLGR